MRRTVLIPIMLAVFTLGAGVASAQAPTWNSGYYGWWPGGFGYRPVTVQAHNYPCSVTAYGPTFHVDDSRWSQDYGASTACAGGVGRKTLTVYEQVLGGNGHTWYTIAGTQATAGPTYRNPVRIIRHRAAVLGHTYRTVATAHLLVPNGFAGCSLRNACDESLTVTAISRPLAP